MVALGATVGAAGIIAGHFLSKALKKPRKTISQVQKGDMIQWESNGAFVFSQPKEVVDVDKAPSGTYVFVEDSATGIPIEQVVVVKRHVDEDEPESDEPRWSSQIVRRHPDYVR